MDAHFKAWQEGYQDETYSSEKLAQGIRLRVRRGLLALNCGKYRKFICICTE